MRGPRGEGGRFTCTGSAHSATCARCAAPGGRAAGSRPPAAPTQPHALDARPPGGGRPVRVVLARAALRAAAAARTTSARARAPFAQPQRQADRAALEAELLAQPAL